MFPIRDENPTVHTSVATYVIIGLNVATWIFLQGMGANPALAKSICEYGFVPGEILGLVEPGTAIPLSRSMACIIEDHPNWLSILTSMFMHGGWFHLISNMWFLVVFGDNVEDAFGTVKYVLFYLACGIAAIIVQTLFDPASPAPMVGASGAISGVMGAYAVLYPRAPVQVLVFFGFFFTRIAVPAFLMLGYWFVLQLLGGLPTIGGATGGVAFWAHIGGFVAGIAMVKWLCKGARAEECIRKRGRIDRLFTTHRRYW